MTIHVAKGFNRENDTECPHCRRLVHAYDDYIPGPDHEMVKCPWCGNSLDVVKYTYYMLYRVPTSP